MFAFFKTLLANLWGGHDDERRHETSFQANARLLEMDQPTAGAGALNLGRAHKGRNGAGPGARHV
jgi:hypothetical protein